MTILHIGLLSYYTEGMLYQDNILPQMNIQDGHKVVFVSNASKYVNGVLQSVDEEDIVLDDGMRLIRLNYDYVINRFITNKIQKVSKLKKILEEVKPDVILYHGLCGYELMDVACYSKKNNVTFYVDSHEDFTNTAKTAVSKLAYKYIHGYFIKRALQQIKKVLYITAETKDYLVDMYGLPDEKMELYPLGGIIQSKDRQNEQRNRLLEQYDLPEDAIILSHSGKLSKEKKTIELIKAFSSVISEKLVLFIIGSVPESERQCFNELIANDKRIRYLGWKNGQELLDILCGTDVYLQPGSQSATSQVALCSGCALVVAPTRSYKQLYEDSVLYVDGIDKLKELIEQIKENASLVEEYKRMGYDLALKKLDYAILSRVYLK
ncbi:glycosyltransferase family 4 protein [Butyrivibrio sp. VCB2001]|uniref:glycosyltransferase family 4 protein n=1 Tax=Butyrivibrio sp. VCB2001 TaxID=1280667 RepID=UPI00042445E6|nr:glycosyltransferase family 4 protein [Butyrivibrio sp. VCB2001]